MNPITDLNFWLHLGNLFAATAIALFAIKSGYFDNKINNVYEVNVKLTEFIEDIEEKYKELYGEDIKKIYYECGYENENSLLGIDLLNISKIDINKLINSFKLVDREYCMIMESVVGEYIEKNIIQKMYKDLSTKIPLSVFREIFFGDDFLKEQLNVDNITKKTLVLLYKATIAAIQANDIEYRLIDGKKKKLNGYISDERMLYLFAAGIAIQFSSLFAPPIIITTVVASSPAIVIVIGGLLLLFDEIKPFYEKLIAEEDKHKRETDKASK